MDPKDPPYTMLEEEVIPGEENVYEEKSSSSSSSSRRSTRVKDPSSWSGVSSPSRTSHPPERRSLSPPHHRPRSITGGGGRERRERRGGEREKGGGGSGNVDYFTRGSFIGREVGLEVGIDDVVRGGESESDNEEEERHVHFMTRNPSSPLLEEAGGGEGGWRGSVGGSGNDRFFGLHRSDSGFPSEGEFESLRDGTLGQDLRDTFIQMECRKVKRMTAAKYREDPRSWIWGILYTLVMLMYLFVKYLFYERYCADIDTSNYAHVWNNPNMVNLGKEVVLVLVLGICFVSITDNFQSLATTLTVFFLYVLTVFFFMFGDTVGCSLIDIESEGYQADQVGVIEMFIVWLLILAIVWSIHLFYYYVMPFIVRETRMCFGWRRLRSITIPMKNTKIGGNTSEDSAMSSDRSHLESLVKMTGSMSGDESGEIEESTRVREVVFQYRPLMNGLGLCWSTARHTFLYRGEMVNGRPNGWGQWRDDSFYGESLTGFWKNGEPFGPFNSCEKGTGNIFSAVIVGYCSMRTDDWKCLPEDEREGPLKFGLSCVECCISGDFYANFPNLTWLPESEHTCTCVMRGDSEGKFCSKIIQLLPNMRHIEANQVLSSVVVSSTPEGELNITGHLPDIPENGHKAKISSRSEKGQGMPSLVIENWHYQTSNEAIVFIHGYNIPLDWSLKKFGQMLAGAGYPSFIKPFLFSWPTGKLFFYTKAVEMAEHPDTAVAFQHFLENLMHAGIKAVHILSHSMGIRLFLNAFAQEEVQALFVPKGGEPKSTQMQLASVTMCNPDYPLVKFRDIDYPCLRRYCSLITVYSDQGDTALKYSAIYASERSLGRQAGPLLKVDPRTRKKKPLDLDVVDTTDLQDNMHAVRHSAFNVNRIMLEDMRELIVQKKRAVHRSSRLVKKQHNFFVFMTIPSMVNGNVV